VLALSLFAVAGEMGKATTVKGWVTDTECAAHGVKNCGNKEHLEKGAKLAFVSESDNKVWTVENPDKLIEHMGQYVQVKGIPNAENKTIRIEEVAMLKEKNNKY
jgi:hypothetical protein